MDEQVAGSSSSSSFVPPHNFSLPFAPAPPFSFPPPASPHASLSPLMRALILSLWPTPTYATVQAVYLPRALLVTDGKAG